MELEAHITKKNIKFNKKAYFMDLIAKKIF